MTPDASLFTDLPRPTGPRFVRWEDTHVPGDTLQQTLNRVTGGRVLTFPVGEFLIPDNFVNGSTEGVRIGHRDWAPGCGGIAGSGRGTVFKMLSATRARLTSGDNSYALINAQPKGGSDPDPRTAFYFGNFTIEGTALGTDGLLDYNGLRIVNSDGSVIERVYVAGVTGSDKVPPGETGAFVTLACTNTTFRNCEVDGRRGGVPVSATGWLMNKSKSTTITDCWGHHNAVGMSGIAWWWCWGNNVVDRFWATDHCLAPGSKGGNCHNHEQTTRVVYIDPVTICGRDQTGAKVMHYGVNWDKASQPGSMLEGVPEPDSDIVLIRPVWDRTAISQYLLVERWGLSPKERQLQARKTIALKADGTEQPIRWVGADPIKSAPTKR